MVTGSAGAVAQPSSQRVPLLFPRLSIMMFLQFAVWGAWSVVIAGHMAQNLHFDGKQISYVFGTTAFGSILAPLIAGWIADRYMSCQKFAAWSHLLGSALLFSAWLKTDFWPLWLTMLLYAFTYMPTVALTNTVAFYHMGQSEKFGNIRVWGTLGWIAVQTALAGYLWFSKWVWNFIGYTMVTLGAADAKVWPKVAKMAEQFATARQGDCLLIAAAAALLMGLYCFTLPDTPPSKEAKNPYAFLEAFALARNRNFLVLLLISFIVAIELPFYYNLTYLFLTEKAGGMGLDHGAAQFAMTLGQWGEVILMFLLWPMLKYGGMRWTIFLGILAWPLRYTIFAIGHPAWLVIASQTLHGICFSFFFVGGMIAVERLAPRDIRASAQGLMVFATNGCGMLVGHFVSGRVHDYFRLAAEDHHAWAKIFLVPIVVTVVAAAIFVSMFSEKQFQEDAARVHAADPKGEKE